MQTMLDHGPYLMVQITEREDFRRLEKLIQAIGKNIKSLAVGDTVLQLACAMGQVKAVEVLIQNAKQQNFLRLMLLQTNWSSHNAFFTCTFASKECLKVLCNAVADWPDMPWAQYDS